MYFLPEMWRHWPGCSGRFCRIRKRGRKWERLRRNAWRHGLRGSTSKAWFERCRRREKTARLSEPRAQKYSGKVPLAKDSRLAKRTSVHLDAIRGVSALAVM